MHRSSKVAKQIFMVLIIIFLFSSKTNAQDPLQQNGTDSQYPEVTLFSTEKRTIHSDIVNQNFDIYISLPYTYSHSKTTYPVLFNLDANMSFGITENVVHVLSTLNKEIPEMIVVGIAYPIKGIEDWAAWRCRDFRPTTNPDKDQAWQERLSKATGRDDIAVKSGEAEKFLTFICEELIPFIDSNYRISKKDRAITGISASGLFVLYSLFQKPETFQLYFAASPSINWDEAFMYKLESDFASSHDDLPVRLYMCVGGVESESYIYNMNKMAELLRSRKYPNLIIKTMIFEDETHGSIYTAAISRALKSLYNK